MGGQNGDKGEIVLRGGRVCSRRYRFICSAAKIGHVGYMAEGMIKVGDKVTLKVDAEITVRISARTTVRPICSRRHSRTVLGAHVEQAGSLVTPKTGCALTLRISPAMTPEEIEEGRGNCK